MKHQPEGLAHEPRYALYFAPQPSSDWSRFGVRWLGRHAFDGAEFAQSVIDGVDQATVARLTAAPRRYGFHATLKAPFRLAPGKTLAMLAAQVDRFCAERAAFLLGAPAPLLLDNFLALAWPTGDTRVAAIEAACVTRFDDFRAPLSAADLARRRAAGLTAREEELLIRWGYPHVLDQYRMHLSLTGPLGDTPAQQVAALVQAARSQVEALGAATLWFDGISIFEETAPEAPLRVVHRAGFADAAKGRLIYIAGPSGAGKDSVIDFARRNLPPGAQVRFAQRSITRPASDGGEQHLAVTHAQFEAREAGGEFALAWRAHGNAYGIGREIIDWLAAGKTVVVSGSREYLPEARALFPAMQVVLVTANAAILKSRLETRGREDAPDVEARLARLSGGSFAPPDVMEICNDGQIDAAGGRLLGLLLGRATAMPVT